MRREPGAGRLFTRLRERYREAGFSVILALLATIIFVVSPLAGTGRLSAEVAEALRFGLAATAILVVTRNRLFGALVAATFVVSFACRLWLKSGAAGEAAHLANIGLTIAFDLAVAWTVAHAAFDGGRITVHRIMAAVILYLYVGLVFAGFYRLAAELLHPSFSGLTPLGGLGDLIYFSLGVLTTSGGGGLTPVHPFIRSLVSLESVIGALYPATFLARLVTLHGAASAREDRKEH
jgi:hypothetical protein